METLDGPDLVDKVKGLLDAARAQRVPVMYVEHVGFGQERPPQDALATDPRIAPLAGEPVVRKLYGDAFVGTSFDSELKRRGIGHLVLCGLATQGCLNAACAHAKALGYEVTVVEDANAAAGGSPVEKTAQDVVADFLEAWRKMGVTLVRARDLDFSRLRA